MTSHLAWINAYKPYHMTTCLLWLQTFQLKIFSQRSTMGNRSFWFADYATTGRYVMSSDHVMSCLQMAYVSTNNNALCRIRENCNCTAFTSYELCQEYFGLRWAYRFCKLFLLFFLCRSYIDLQTQCFSCLCSELSRTLCTSSTK